MREVPPFPWDQLQPYRDLASRHPDNVIDLSIGSPVDSTPESSQHALSQAADAHAYPATIGTNELRTAILKWLRRRRNVTVTHDEILPTVGSKEFIALLPFVLGLGQETPSSFQKWPTRAMRWAPFLWEQPRLRRTTLPGGRSRPDSCG